MRIDFGFGHVDIAFDFAFAQALHQYLATNFFAKFLPAHAVLFQQPAEFGHRQIIFIGNALQRFIERFIVDPDAGFFCFLHLHRVVDHAIKQLLAQFILRRQFGALLL